MEWLYVNHMEINFTQPSFKKMIDWSNMLHIGQKTILIGQWLLCFCHNYGTVWQRWFSKPADESLNDSLRKSWRRKKKIIHVSQGQQTHTFIHTHTEKKVSLIQKKFHWIKFVHCYTVKEFSFKVMKFNKLFLKEVQPVE